MKRRFLSRSVIASLFSIIVMSAAVAADLRVKAPVVAPVPVFSWTGVYVGIGGGPGWGEKEYAYNQDSTIQAVLAQGPFFGNPGIVGTTQGSKSISGGFFGGQVGANWQAGWLVLGAQADAHWADLHGSGPCFNVAGLNTAVAANGGVPALGTNCDAKVTSFGSITARLGAAFDRMLVYAQGGWAWESTDRGFSLTGVPIAVLDPTATITAARFDETRSGWTVGAGIEYAFAPNWSAFVDYRYFDFGTKTRSFSLQAVVPALAPSNYTVPFSIDATESFHAVKFGVNYRFGWAAPLIAKY